MAVPIEGTNCDTRKEIIQLKVIDNDDERACKELYVRVLFENNSMLPLLQVVSVQHLIRKVLDPCP